MKRERDDTANDQPTSAPASVRHGDEATEDADPGIAPLPEATGSIPLTIAPTGGPAPLGAPVGEPPEETRRLALWVAAALVVLVILVALIVWL